MNKKTSKWVWLPVVVACAVATSLGVVWILSLTTGMRFNPAVVGGVSGAIAAYFYFNSCSS